MIKPPSEHMAGAFADWLEATLLFTNRKRLTRTDIGGIFGQEGVLDDEVHLSNLLREIDRRTKYIGGYYPLELERTTISRKKSWRNSLVYSFMLLVSLNRHYSTLTFKRGAANKPAELFECLIFHTFKRYLNGDSIRFGTHRRPPTPRDFIDAVKYICKRTNERFKGEAMPESNVGDDDLDIISWRPFRDRRSGQLILLGQCTIGVDWDDKLRDLSLGLWNKHIDWAVSPTRAFAVPFIHDDNGWDRITAEGGIIFDRVRISSLIRPTDLPKNLSTAIKEWCVTRIESLPRLES